MTLTGQPVTSSKSWPKLVELAKQAKLKDIRNYFEDDQHRARELCFEGPQLTLDISRQNLDAQVLAALLELLVEREFVAAKAALLTGGLVNSTENRPALHTALRAPETKQIFVDGHDVVPQVHKVLEQMATLATNVRQGRWLGATGKPIRHVVNIGIGGSDLGPVMAYEALRNFATPEITFHFVSNVDATDLVEVLKQVKLDQTLFIVASKTFTTQETMLNANTAKQVLLNEINSIDQSVIAKHFVALSTNTEKVLEFGIERENIFGFWDWVGGRYSLSSAIGLSTMIAIGPELFSELLSGFHEMDEHFAATPFAENLPVLMGLVAFWNRSLLDVSSVAVLPYNQYLKRFPAYLQQLTMESNGKSVTRNGALVEVETGQIYWGEPGTNGQHSFYQLIHQGTSKVACDLIVTAKGNPKYPEHQDALVSNAISQARVLAFGRTEHELVSAGVQADLVAHKIMPGNHPTNLLRLSELNPKSLGALVALYEHSVFVQSVLWGINAFDQWGVELGKEVANSILPLLTNTDSTDQFDSATAQAINWYREYRSN